MSHKKVFYKHRITLKVTPQASINSCFWDNDLHIIKVYVTTAPEKGKANNAVLELLSKTLDLPKRNIIIVQGMTTRNKIIEIITTCSKEDLIIKLPKS